MLNELSERIYKHSSLMSSNVHFSLELVYYMKKHLSWIKFLKSFDPFPPLPLFGPGFYQLLKTETGAKMAHRHNSSTSCQMKLESGSNIVWVLLNSNLGKAEHVCHRHFVCMMSSTCL